MAVLLRREFPEVDLSKLIRICVVHDLGEAVVGDIPAVDQDAAAPKAAQERFDLLDILAPINHVLFTLTGGFDSPDHGRTLRKGSWCEREG